MIYKEGDVKMKFTKKGRMLKEAVGGKYEVSWTAYERYGGGRKFKKKIMAKDDADAMIKVYALIFYGGIDEESIQYVKDDLEDESVDITSTKDLANFIENSLEEDPIDYIKNPNGETIFRGYSSTEELEDYDESKSYGDKMIKEDNYDYQDQNWARNLLRREIEEIFSRNGIDHDILSSITSAVKLLKEKGAIYDSNIEDLQQHLLDIIEGYIGTAISDI